MELHYYQTSGGRRPFIDWLERLKDRQARARIEARTQQRDINRAKECFEDYKARAAQAKPRGRA
jgi:putative component of toxin-antitoxin plasmid stabilization module